MISGPDYYTTTIDMSSASSTITLGDLDGGSSYRIQFSISLYDGMYYYLEILIYFSIASLETASHLLDLLFKFSGFFFVYLQMYFVF